MSINESKVWIENFYKQRKWSEYGPFERVTFLMEEVGEIAQVVRAYEIGRDRPDEQTKTLQELEDDLREECGDVLVNLIILMNMYGFSLEGHREKLTHRFKNCP